MRKLGRKKSNREHLIRNLAASLVLYETIDTTMPKAKETKSYLDRLIARCKKADLQAVRRADASLFDKNAAKKLIVELLPRYATRNSGFIKSYHLKNRSGDNSSMMRLELVDKKTFVTETANINVKTKVKKSDETKAEVNNSTVKVREKKNDNK